MKRAGTIGMTAVAVALVLGFYTWSAWAANAFGDWGDWDYYRMLVRGFRQGHLHLDKAPPPELLALANPYDPAQNGPYRLPDASYYKGHYYIYFGAAPAATLMLPYSLLTGGEMTTGAAVWVFCCVAYLALCGLWLAIRGRYFPGSAAWLAPLGVLGLGASTHLLTLLRRPMWWELPIAAGIAFTLLALVAVYRAIHGRRPRLAMAAAGLCLGLAVASRPTCLLALPLLAGPLWLRWWRARNEGRPRAAAWRATSGWAIAAAVPLALCALAIMAYNYGRFENPFEFGRNYQLAGADESQLTHFSLRYLPHNFTVLFLQPLKWTWEFPFVMAWGDHANIPGYYGTEEVAGLLLTFPFVAFALAVPLVWRRRAPGEREPLLATVGATAGYLIPVGLLILCFFATTARYTADFASALALLAACGLLGLEHWARADNASRVRVAVWRAVGVPLVVAAGSISVPIAALLSFDYHGRAPSREHPARWAVIERAVERAIGRVGLWLGWYAGPVVLDVVFPPRPPGHIEPLWEPVDADAAERILVRHADGTTLNFGYARAGAPVRWSLPVETRAGHRHRIELQLPSLHGPPDRWVHGFRRNVAFRERSAVALWVDGVRALATIVPPLPEGRTPGGALAGGFPKRSGRPRMRLLRDDELPLMGEADWTVGGPRPQPGQPAVPLLTTGQAGAGNALSLEPTGAGTARLVFDQWGRPVRHSPEFRLPEGGRLTVEIESAPLWPWSAAADEAQPLAVWINGRLVWETRVRFHASGPEQVWLARNAIGATTCAPDAATGWAVTERWPRTDGGTLRMRVVPALPVARAGEPFLAVGALYGSDTIGYRGTGAAADEAQVFFEHFGAPVVEGSAFRLAPGALQVVRVTLPSFNPARFTEPDKGDVVVRIDEREVFRSPGECYGSGDIAPHVGRNRFGGSVSGPAFRGWLLDWRWTGVMENGPTPASISPPAASP